MYQALYRKYRPRSFDDVAGQEHITETLKTQVASGRLSHAYLFIGTRGTGKTTCAKILAKAANCEHPVNGGPCGECPACRGIDDGSVMDVVEIDAASNNGVENVRALRDEAVFSPASVKKRVYIIDEVHMLSGAAFNALLKILEEPPEHLMFILATTELRKVPATILSRCQRYSFRRIESGVISKRLDYVAEKENLSLTPDASALLARLADGSMRDALSLLDQCSGADKITPDTVLSAMGLAGNRRTAELLTAVANRDGAEALREFSTLWRDGKDAATLLSDLCLLMRDLLILSVAPGGGSELLSGGYDGETLRSFEGRFTDAELLRDMKCIQAALASLRDNPAPRTAAELCLVSLCDDTLTDGLPELIARVSRLEELGVSAPRETAARAPRMESAKAPKPEAPEISFDKAPSPEPPTPIEPLAPSFAPDNAPDDAYAPPEPTYVYEPEPDMPENFRPAPAETPEPHEAPAPAAPAVELSWAAVVSAAKKKLPAGYSGLLDDPLLADGAINGDTLILRLAAGFAAGMLSRPDILSVFQQEASALAGRPICVKTEGMDASAGLEKRSLDDLAAFGIKYK